MQVYSNFYIFYDAAIYSNWEFKRTVDQKGERNVPIKKR
jgi:hypothetical protein